MTDPNSPDTKEFARPSEELQITEFLDAKSQEIQDNPEILLKKIAELTGVKELKTRELPGAILSSAEGASELFGTHVTVSEPSPQKPLQRVIILNTDNPEQWLEEYSLMTGESKASGPRSEFGYSEELVNKLTDGQFTKLQRIMLAINRWNSKQLEVDASENGY